MTLLPDNPRVPDAPVDQQFLDRWSPRSFTDEPVTDQELKSLFEAARWAPSSGNEQPWVYLYASTPDDHALFLDLLDRGNQAWAFRAPVLAFAIGRRHTRKGNPNRTFMFDTGSSWMSLALEARKLGLYAHGMAGFDVERSYDMLKVPRDRYEVIAAIAIGHRGDPSVLTENNRAREFPNSRKHVDEFAFPGVMPESHR